MKKLNAAALAAAVLPAPIPALVTALVPATAMAGWNDPQTPFQLYGNSYYVVAESAASIKASMDMVAALPCDLLVTSHPEFSGLWERLARQPKLGNAAMLDSAGCRDYASGARANLEKRLASERAGG